MNSGVPLSNAGAAVIVAAGILLALALELQFGADILSTAIAPSWDQIGKLGAVTVIRTALNFLLTRELREAGQAVSRSDTDPGQTVDATAMPQPA